MKKTVLIVLASIVVLVLGAGFAGQAWLKGRFEKESLIAEMEAAWNCRAHLDSTTLTLGGSPAMVELHGLKLSPRDAEAGKPLGQRTPFPEQAALLSADRISLSMTLGDLVSRRINVKALHISGLNVRAEVSPEGVSNLDAMFDSPEDAAKAAAAPTAPAVAVTVPAEATLAVEPGTVDSAVVAAAPVEQPVVKGKGGSAALKKKKVKVAEDPLMASDLGMALEVEEASVEKGTVEIVDMGSATRTRLDGVSFALKGIDVNPGDLANHNRCGFEFSGTIKVDNPVNQVQGANFDVTGNGMLEPFEAQTGIWNPDLNLAVMIKKGGLLGGAPLAAQMKPKDLAKLKEFGLDLGTLALGGVLQEDASTEIHAVRSKLIVKKDTRLVFPDYEISLLSASWFNSPEDSHNTRGRLVASAELTNKLLGSAQTTLSERLGESLASIAIATVTATLLDEQKRLVLPFKSKGSLSKPEVGLDTALSGATDSLKDAGRDLLKGLLGN